MKRIIQIIFVAVICGLITGFYLKGSGNLALGDKIIGGSILVLFFVLMPIFSFHRWKGKDMRNYMLTKENLDKMNGISDKKEKNTENQRNS